MMGPTLLVTFVYRNLLLGRGVLLRDTRIRWLLIPWLSFLSTTLVMAWLVLLVDLLKNLVSRVVGFRICAD